MLVSALHFACVYGWLILKQQPTELVSFSKTPDTGVKNSMLRALHEVVTKAGANMSETSKLAILGLIDDGTGDRDGKTADPANDRPFFFFIFEKF